MKRKTERRHQQGAESRRRILDATIEIAAERGYEGTTVSLVSKRSGLPASSIYWHFENKDELIAAVIQRSFDEWSADLAAAEETALGAGSTSRDQVVAVIRHEAASLARHEDFLRFGLMLALEQREEEPVARTLFLEVRELSLRRIEDSYRRYFAHHGAEVDDAYVASLAVLTMAAVDGIFLAGQARPGTDPTPVLDLLAAAIDLLTRERIEQSRGDTS